MWQDTDTAGFIRSARNPPDGFSDGLKPSRRLIRPSASDHCANAPKCGLAKPSAVSVLTLLLPTAGEQFAVKGDDALRQAEAEGGGGRRQIARRVAARRAERPLRAGQHQRLSKPCSARANRLAV